MAYPAGTTMATISVGHVIDFFGRDATLAVHVSPVFKGKVTHLVHAATGMAMIPSNRTFDAPESHEVTFEVPHTDQPGWLGPGGVSAAEWAYQVRVTAREVTGKATAWEKTINAPSSQTGTIDFDLIPAGAPVDPVDGEIAVVTSINGQTGAVLLDAGMLTVTEDPNVPGTALIGE